MNDEAKQRWVRGEIAPARKEQGCEELDQAFRNPLLVVDIATGEVKIDRLQELWDYEGIEREESA